MSNYQDDGRMVYHSRRPNQPWAEDQGEESRPGAPRSRSRNRSLVIILIDVAVILLIYAVISTFLNSDSWRGTIAGVEAELHVQTGEQESLWQLHVTRRKAENGALQSRIITVVFSDGAGYLSDPVMDVVPQRVGERRVLDAVAPPGATLVRASITANGEQLQLKRRTSEAR